MEQSEFGLSNRDLYDTSFTFEGTNDDSTEDDQDND